MEKYLMQENSLVMHNSEVEYVIPKIKDLPDSDKPREKLLRQGPGALSSSELLAVVLGVGTRKEEVMQMTSRVLKEYGERGIISEKDPKNLVKELDIPLFKAVQIVACFELGRRFFRKSKGGPVVVRTPKQAYQYLRDMRDLPKEHLRGLYLNSRHRLVHDEVISVGSLTANIAHPREVFGPALEHSAVAVIIAHNHPSGSTIPTKSDIEITEQLVEAGRILGVELLDHLIVTKNRFSSVPVKYS